MTRRLLRAALYALLALVVLSLAAAFWARAELRGSLAQLDGSHRASGPVGARARDAGRPGHPDHSGRHARGCGSGDRAFFTRRIASSRWTWRAAVPPGSLPRSSVLARWRSIARSGFTASAPKRSVPSPWSAPPGSGGARRLHVGGQRRPRGARHRRPSSTSCCARRRSRGGRKTRSSSSCRCSSRCRTPTARTRRRWRRCTTILPQAMFDFLNPKGSEWDAPVVGPAFSVPPIPGPEVYDLRSRRTGKQLPTPNVQLPTPIPPNRAASKAPGHWELGVGSWELGVRARRTRSDRKQQLRGLRTPDSRRRRAARQRHAPRHPRAEYVVPRGVRVAGSLESVRAASPLWRQPARRPGDGDRQQHARRVGIHQHLRRLGRRRPARHRSRAAQPLSDAVRMARVRTIQRGLPDRRTGRPAPGDVVDDLGTGARTPTTAAGCARTGGWRTPPIGSLSPSCRSS